jgi:uncharacterized repeat protein (TIGR01451 family)
MWVLVGCCFLGLAWAGTSIWVLNQTPVSDTLNGISAPNSNFAIAVGENGAIVHFIDGDSGTVMPSGTTEELFDVYASSPNLAVATGEDVVLLWDGVSWTTLRAESDGTIFTGTWISPEEDIILYGFIASGFGGFVCPKIPNDETPLFCRGFLNELMLTACGNSDDIKLFTTSGDIYNVNNLMGDVNGFDPIHDEPGSLSLGGVWIPEGYCVPGPKAPLEAFAIKNFPAAELWHFDGSSWAEMNVTVPVNHTFTWIGGIDSNNVTAVGFKPDNMGGNSGVVWHFDGSTWTEDMTLPVDTPGLTDIAVNISVPDFIFMDGFESSINRMSNEQRYGRNILASAEFQEGIGEVLRGDDALDVQYTDLLVEKTRLSTGPFSNGDSITYQIVVQNVGPVSSTAFRLFDTVYISMDYVSDTCGFIENETSFDWTYFDANLPSLAPSQVMICNMTLTINGEVGDEIINGVQLLAAKDYNQSNNTSSSRGIYIQAP